MDLTGTVASPDLSVIRGSGQREGTWAHGGTEATMGFLTKTALKNSGPEFESCRPLTMLVAPCQSISHRPLRLARARDQKNVGMFNQ